VSSMDRHGQKARMLAGELYRGGDPALIADSQRADRLLRVYDTVPASEAARRSELLAELLGAVGREVVVRTPFHCDYGYNIRLGDGVFINFGCIFLDVAAIEIGEACQIGPGVQLLTPDHPRDPALRREGWECGRPICLGCNVWVGGGALIL